MVRYLVHRVLGAVIVLLGVSVLAFVVTIASGDPAVLMLPPDATTEEVEAFREAMGFNDPVHIQYLRFLTNALHGDFGRSIRHQEPAFNLVLERMPATIQLSVAGMALALCTGIPLGILAALRRHSLMDLVAMGIALFGQSMANFWLGIMLIYLFAVQLNWLPSFGRGELRHLILPAFTVATRLVAILTRMTRSSMLEVLGEDYVRTARAKGLRETTVIVRHALRNAMIPIVTIVALQFGTLMGGTVIIETVFTWPGVGLLTVQAIYNRDYPVVQASVFVLALAFVAVNLLADILYGIIDPRIRLH